MARVLTWVSDKHLTGWACSACDWTFPLPSLLSDPEAKKAVDRILKKLLRLRIAGRACGQVAVGEIITAGETACRHLSISKCGAKERNYEDRYSIAVFRDDAVSVSYSVLKPAKG